MKLETRSPSKEEVSIGSSSPDLSFRVFPKACCYKWLRVHPGTLVLSGSGPTSDRLFSFVKKQLRIQTMLSYPNIIYTSSVGTLVDIKTLLQTPTSTSPQKSTGNRRQKTVLTSPTRETVSVTPTKGHTSPTRPTSSLTPVGETKIEL